MDAACSSEMSEQNYPTSFKNTGDHNVINTFQYKLKT